MTPSKSRTSKHSFKSFTKVLVDQLNKEIKIMKLTLIMDTPSFETLLFLLLCSIDFRTSTLKYSQNSCPKSMHLRGRRHLFRIVRCFPFWRKIDYSRSRPSGENVTFSRCIFCPGSIAFDLGELRWRDVNPLTIRKNLNSPGVLSRPRQYV